MKYAIIITGNIRTWELCKPNFIESFSHLNPDVFVSTYDLQYGYHPAQQQWMQGTPDNYLTDDEINDMMSEINPIHIIVESYASNKLFYNNNIKPVLHQNFKDDLHTYLQYSKLNTILSSIKYQEELNGFKYDYIIKLRPDINHNKFLYDINNDTVILSNGNVYPNDVIIATNRDNFINIISFMLDEFYSPTYDDSHIELPHRLLLNAINHFNLTIETQPLMNYVVRKTGNQYY